MGEKGSKKIIEHLPKNENYFVTLDIYELDYSLSHGTGTPSLGGFFMMKSKKC